MFQLAVFKALSMSMLINAHNPLRLPVPLLALVLVTNLLVTILKTRPHRSFSTSPIEFFQHWSRLFCMPYPRADFSIFHASCSRRSRPSRLCPTKQALAAPSRIHWVTPFLDAKLNALVVTQGYYLEDEPVTYSWGKTRRGNRDTPLPRFSSVSKIPAQIQYNEVVPSDHLTDQDSPPVQMGFSPLGRLAIKVDRNKGPPTSVWGFLQEGGSGSRRSRKDLG